MEPLNLMLILSCVAVVLGGMDIYQHHTIERVINWRLFLARLPLPMLALAASYGVYSFALLFVPQAVAMIQAAAFELTYIGLAVTQGLNVDQRKRATLISVGAVVASIVYNTLSGWFYRQPELLSGATPVAWLMLAILHGAPLAWVAYLVADLLLHSGEGTALATLPERLDAPEDTDRAVEAVLPETAQQQAVLDELLSAPLAPILLDAHRYSCPHCGQAVSNKQALGAAVKNGYCLKCKQAVKQSA